METVVNPCGADYNHLDTPRLTLPDSKNATNVKKKKKKKALWVCPFTATATWWYNTADSLEKDPLPF